MAQLSLFWDGQILGDCGPYTISHLHDRFFRSILGSDGDRGVVKGWRDELEVSGNSSPLSVAAGGACVYGGFYDTEEAVSVSVATPATGLSRYDRIVVRRDWGTQLSRIARVVGTAAMFPVVPTLTQTVGVTWEIPLATALVTSAGSISLTDNRLWLAYPLAYAANIVTAGMFEEGAVTADKRPDRTRYCLRGSRQIQPDSVAPCTWTAGPPYDHWSFANGAFNRAWTYFGGDTQIVTSTVSIYAWSVPDVNGAGGGAENCQWDYSIYTGNVNGAPTNTAGSVNVDQQARVNTTVYADLILAGLTVGPGYLVGVRLSRDGAADSYASAMRLLGIEMRWTADA